MEELLGPFKGIPAGTVWAIGWFLAAVSGLRLQPALSRWLEVRAETKSVDSTAKLNGKLVEAIQTALADSASFQRLIDGRITHKLANWEQGANWRLDALEGWRRTHEAEVKDALERMAKLEAALTAFQDTAKRVEDRFETQFERLEAKLTEWLDDRERRLSERIDRLSRLRGDRDE